MPPEPVILAEVPVPHPVGYGAEMKWTSALAIYVLFWAFSVFLVLPFGVRTTDEAGGERVPGQADSAPHDFAAGRIALRVTVVASVLFGLFYLNFVYGWVTADMLDWTR